MNTMLLVCAHETPCSCSVPQCSVVRQVNICIVLVCSTLVTTVPTTGKQLPCLLLYPLLGWFQITVCICMQVHQVVYIVFPVHLLQFVPLHSCFTRKTQLLCKIIQASKMVYSLACAGSVQQNHSSAFSWRNNAKQSIAGYAVDILVRISSYSFFSQV